MKKNIVIIVLVAGIWWLYRQNKSLQTQIKESEVK